MRSEPEVRVALIQFNRLIDKYIALTAMHPLESTSRLQAHERAAHYAGIVQALRWALGELEQITLPPGDREHA
jgi:hypothetical protein